MNKQRRAAFEKVRDSIETISNLIHDAESAIGEIQAQEEEARDNLPQSMQEGERGEKMQEAIDTLDSFLEYLGEAGSALEEAGMLELEP